MCNARLRCEYLEDEGEVVVYHLGEHTCHVKIDPTEQDEYLKKIISENRNIGARQIQLSDIKKHLETGDVKGAREAAAKSSNFNRLKHLKSKTAPHHPSSMAAVSEIKRSIEKDDP